MKTRMLFLVLAILMVGAFVTHPAWGRRTLSRGQIAHTIEAPGWSGRPDDNSKVGNLSFGYPMGRWLKVYSGGLERDGWNPRSNSAGEGFWVMSKTNGKVHISYAGNNRVSSDVITHDFTQANWPEAYVGVVENEHWALSIRKRGGAEADWTIGVPLENNTTTNWWPESGGILAASTIRQTPALIWNYRYGRYNSGEPYASRIAAGEFPQYNAPSWVEALSEDDFPEQIGIQRARSSQTGLEWTRKWYSWGHADYDDFIINESVIENTSNATVENVYINIQNRFAQQATKTWRGQGWYRAFDWNRDDHARSSAATNYLEGVSRQDFVQGRGKPAGLQALKELAEKGHPLLYYHDGESDHITNLIPDVGDPFRYELAWVRFSREQAWIPEGMIQQGQYFGIGVVDALPPFNTYGGADPEVYVAPHNNPETSIDESRQQPAAVTIWRYTDVNNYEQPVPFRHHDRFISDEHVYETLSKAGYHSEPDEAYAYTHHMTFGPWTLGPGEKAKVVVAYVGGMGGDAPKYKDYKRYSQPFNFAWMTLSDGFGGLGNVPLANRQAEIPLGEDALAQHFKRAIDAYAWGYDLPNQPPSIKVTTQSDLQGQMTLSWSAFGEDAQNPDYAGAQAQDLQGYRIYRSKNETMGPWEFVSEFSFEDARSGAVRNLVFDPAAVWRSGPVTGFESGIPLKANPYAAADHPDAGADVPGVYTYSDQTTKAGFPYWYSVRYYHSGHGDWKGTGQAVPPLESAPGPSGGAITGGRFGVVPVVPGHATFDRLEAKIKIVPNVWKVDDNLYSYERQQNIRFTNLPGRAQIDLYTADGQRFWTFFHDNLNQGEATYIQFTENRPSNFGHSLFPGIYFWKVTSMMPESLGKTQMGTFMIIK